MKIQLKLVNTNEAEKEAMRVIIRETNSIIKGAITNIENEVKKLTRHLMENSKFVNELLYGQLRGHFGIPADEISDSVASIINEVVENIEVSYSNLSLLGKTVRGGLKIGIGKNGFSSLINLKAGTTTTDLGVELNWLDWLLTQGDRIIISEHDIKFLADKGRSGMAIMIPNRVASWRVPAEFSGTLEDNVITREIIKNVEQYSRIMSSLINKQVKSILS